MILDLATIVGQNLRTFFKSDFRRNQPDLSFLLSVLNIELGLRRIFLSCSLSCAMCLSWPNVNKAQKSKKVRTTIFKGIIFIILLSQALRN